MILKLSLTVFLFLSCQTDDKETKHIFYLHGRIIELQGINAISEKFGKYEYQAIIDSLKAMNAVVHHEVRTSTTDYQEFCEHISIQINKLVDSGVKPNNIAVIGASKGAVMAMNISVRNNYAVNYILLGANNDQIEIENNWNLHGRILGIFETSDLLAGKDYQHWIKVSTNAVDFQQLEINTGLGHGFLYRPVKQWLAPTKKWILNKN